MVGSHPSALPKSFENTKTDIVFTNEGFMHYTKSIKFKEWQRDKGSKWDWILPRMATSSKPSNENCP